MSNKPVEPLTPEEDKDLSELSLMSAMSKLNTLSTISKLLWAATEELNSYIRAWNSYSNDPYFLKLKEEIQSLCFSIPSNPYFDRVFEAISGTPAGAYEFTGAGYDHDLRYRDAGISFDRNEDDFPPDLPWEDPIDTYMRKKDV